MPIYRKPEYAQADTPPAFKYDDDVAPLTGKYRGRQGYIMHETYAHPLNKMQRMYAVRVQSGRGFVTLRLQEKNIRKWRP